MRPVVVDTDVASLIWKGQLPHPLAAMLAGTPICLTFVTVGELAKWARVRDWGARRRDDLDRWLRQVPVLPYGDEVAWTWGRIAGDAHRQGRPRPANDMWIAACCLRIGLPLATLNHRDFADFAERDGLRLLR